MRLSLELREFEQGGSSTPPAQQSSGRALEGDAGAQRDLVRELVRHERRFVTHEKAVDQAPDQRFEREIDAAQRARPYQPAVGNPFLRGGSDLDGPAIIKGVSGQERKVDQ